MDKSYNLHLPAWGPYNKTYLGAAHVADREKGLRFDLNLFPGYFRRSVLSVRDLADSGVKMMAASPKLTRFVYRYELEWKDRVYVEADFQSEDHVLTVQCRFVNNTDRPESLSLNAVMSMKGCTQYHVPVAPCEVRVKNGLWIDALDYSAIQTHQKVASDGLYLGERRESGFVGGSYLSAALFGQWGDRVQYRFAETAFDQLKLRYRGGGKLRLTLGETAYDVCLPQTDELTLHPIGVRSGVFDSLTVETLDCAVDFDGFLVGEADFSDGSEWFVPQCEAIEGGMSLRFGEKEYTVRSDAETFVIRKLHTDDAGQLLTTFIHNHVSTELGSGGQTYMDLFIRPVFVAPNSSETVTLTITAPKGEAFPAEHTLAEPACNPSGEKYRISQTIMNAVTLTNVVWPIYSRRGYILHNTPGRNWDSLYTWDSGFIGMGLLELDAERARDCLNAYMTPAGDAHSPYIFHGTPLPTQIFLFAEIFAKTSDVEFLKTFYPMIHQQYRFFADMRKRPNAKATVLFALWDVFYNSGGWDDYPTQKYIHANHLESEVCPVINTAMTVLCAKILKNLAEILSLDTAEFDEDIAFYTNAVNTWAWDEESGYYGYVQNDGTILKVDGVNADMGMDGAFPYIAGISNEERSARIVQNIKEGMCTPIGVSVVDTRAPYFRQDGYWNGSVWMPHQWILWKACLDNGEAELARWIAETALELWERETAYTYNCYEHFMIANGRGGGFHQFSGLSTPVLMWFSAYHTPYTIKTGFQTVIRNRRETEDSLAFDVKSTAKKPVVLICMPEGERYAVQTRGQAEWRSGVCTVRYDGPIADYIVLTKEESE